MLKLDMFLIGYVKKCKYKISDRILAQAHTGRRRRGDAAGIAWKGRGPWRGWGGGHMW